MNTSAPIFLLQIVHVPDGETARLPGGGPLEADLIELCTRHVMAKGVGFFRGKKHVEQDVRAGIKDAIMSLKVETAKLV